MIKNVNLQLSNIYHKKIAVFSDIHYVKGYSLKKLECIYQNLKKNKPDYICIVGDLLDKGNVLEDPLSKHLFITWLRKLSKLASVIISLGNHDVAIYTSHWEYRHPKELLEEITQIPNVHVLNNTVYQDNHICFIGYTPAFSYYFKSSENPDSYIEDFKEKILSVLSKDNYNVLLCHTPIYVTYPKLTSDSLFSSIHLVLSGHMHNGIIPISLKGNYGIISPCKTFFPKYARGNFQIGNTQYYISGGVITFSKVSPKLLHLLNCCFPIHIEYIEI